MKRYNYRTSSTGFLPCNQECCSITYYALQILMHILSKLLYKVEGNY